MKDSFDREITYLRISVTDLCNLRCRYCMPEEGVCKRPHEEILDFEEIYLAVKAAASLGIRKVRITGGEPLIKKGIIDLCGNISSIDGIEEVCITTNAVLLKDLAVPLREAGVSRVNISLDTLNPDKFAYITRIGRLQDTLDGIDAALAAGFEKVKINAVLVGGFNDDEIPDLAGLTRKWPVDVRFIELMPMYDSRDFGKEAFISSEVVLEKLPELKPVDPDNSVARLFRFEDGLGNVGLISPITAHFCNECNRIRLMSDGGIKPCLHSNAEYNIKGLDYEEMVEQFRAAIKAKPRWHGELSYGNISGAGRTMNEIGG